ncbi:MAG: hypothetical protein ACYDEQ_15730, partial [Desulfocucumaceae bacterium]
HYPLFGGGPLEASQTEKIGQIIKAYSEDGEVALDTSVKRLLLYSPACGACAEMVEILAQADPEGKGWLPVQVGGGSEEGRDLLYNSGYRGSNYHYRWDGPVPALVTTSEGSTKLLYGQEEILRVVSGLPAK